MTDVRSSLRPVLALDIDGVLNPYQPGEGYTVHRVVIAADEVPRSPFVTGGGTRALAVDVAVNPDHGRWIRDMAALAEVVWASTWEDAANRHLAPLLGLAPLPVGVSAASHPPRREQVAAHDVAGWKRDALRSRYGGRTLVWLDDQLGDADEVLGVVDGQPVLGSIRHRPDADVRFVEVLVDGWVGLTETHRVVVERVLREG